MLPSLTAPYFIGDKPIVKLGAAPRSAVTACRIAGFVAIPPRPAVGAPRGDNLDPGKDEAPNGPERWTMNPLISPLFDDKIGPQRRFNS